MNERQKGYSLYRLGATTDINTVAGLKKAENRSAYFALLDEFSRTAPELLKRLKDADMDMKSPICSDALERLQTMIVEILSPSLLWKMGKLSSALKWGPKESVPEAYLLMQRSLNSLCEKLRKAEDFHASALEEETPAAGVADETETDRTDDLSKSRKKQILAIDDFPDTLRILKAGLKDRFDVIGVTDHMMALKYLSTRTADLILLDIEMPDMDGFTLLDIIRKLGSYKTTPVLFLTANASPLHVRMAIEHGGNDFLRKPVDLDLLTEKILKYLPDRQESDGWKGDTERQSA